jgi:hypothetical protein
MWRLFKYLLPLILLANTAAYAQSNPTVEAKTDKNKVATGETFTYSLKIEGEFNSPKLRLPAFNDFTIVSQNQQQQYIAKNGSTILIVKANYCLRALNPGNFIIEGASVIDKDRQVKAAAIPIEVTGKPVKDKTKSAPRAKNAIDL